MEKQFKMKFSVPVWLPSHVIELGTVEETVWSLVPTFDAAANYCVVIIRSPDHGKVNIDVKVCYKDWDLLFRTGHPLSNGQKSTHFLFQGVLNPNKSFEGYVTVHYNSNFTGKKEAVTQTECSTLARLGSDLGHLLDSPDDSFSDATLLCDTAKIPVHKVILSARSPVFATMFKIQMQEGREGVVDIVDLEPDVLEVMLRYVYRGKIDNLTSSMAGDLLFAADKYQLEELKLICVHQLKVDMTANNVFRSLVLGDLHDKSLKAHAVEFICKYKNFSDLETTEEWQSLLKEHPSLALDVATTLVKYLQKKCVCAE